MTEHQSSEEGAEGLRLTEAEVQRWAYNDPESDLPVLYAHESVQSLLADRLAAVQAEACQRARWCRNAMSLGQQIDALLARAESAEAEITHKACGQSYPANVVHQCSEAEVGARVLREAAEAIGLDGVGNWLRARADALAAEAGGES